MVVYLFDEHGLHRWEELALERPLSVRARTREVGLVRLEHRWVLDRALEPPQVRAPERGAA